MHQEEQDSQNNGSRETSSSHSNLYDTLTPSDIVVLNQYLRGEGIDPRRLGNARIGQLLAQRVSGALGRGPSDGIGYVPESAEGRSYQD